MAGRLLKRNEVVLACPSGCDVKLAEEVLETAAEDTELLMVVVCTEDVLLEWPADAEDASGPEDRTSDWDVEDDCEDGFELPSREDVVLKCPTLEDDVKGADVRVSD